MRLTAYAVLLGTLLLWSGNWIVARAARADVTMHLMPGITVLLSMLFLGEYPQWFNGAGIVLILAGVALSSSRDRQG